MTATQLEPVTITKARVGATLGRFPGLHAVFLLFMLSLLLAMIPRTMGDPDIWWHLRNAHETVSRHAFVMRDAYSFTVHGVAWIDHEWLAEIPFYLGWRAGGSSGVYLCTVTLIELTFIAIWWLSWRASRSLITTSLTTVAAALLATVSFGPRTLLFGWLCLALQLVVLELFRTSPRVILSLPLLYLLWINLHGSWIIGLAILALFSVSTLVPLQRGWLHTDCLTSTQRRFLALAWAGIPPALFCNPWGWRLVAYPFNFAFRQTLNVANVQEWQSLDLHSFRGRIVLAAILLVIGKQLIKPRDWSLQELLWLAVGLYSAFNYSRFLFLLALLAAPVAARSFPSRQPENPAAEKPILNALLILCLAAVSFVTTRKELRSDDRTMTQYPAAVLPALTHIPPHSRLFNEFLWGGYLEWYSQTNPVFIDSRVDIFEYNDILRDYLKIIHIEDSLELLDLYRIDYVLFEKDTSLAYLLQRSPRWEPAYMDKRIILFSRVKVGPPSR